MKLVKAREEDIDKLKEFWYRLAKNMEQYSDLNTLSYSSHKDVSSEAFQKILENSDTAIYLIKEDNTIGYTIIRHEEKPSREKSSFTEIVDLYITEEERNKGHGTETVKKLKEKARNHGSDYLKVSAEWKNHGARKFYRKNGFKEKQVEYTQQLE